MSDSHGTSVKNPIASHVFADRVSGMLDHKALENCIQYQHDIYKKTRESQRALSTFNAYSAKEFAKIGPELERKTKLLKDMKRDLNSIFDRVSEMREVLGDHYPDFAVLLPEEMDDDEIPSIVKNAHVEPASDSESQSKVSLEDLNLLSEDQDGDSLDNLDNQPSDEGQFGGICSAEDGDNAQNENETAQDVNPDYLDGYELREKFDSDQPETLEHENEIDEEPAESTLEPTQDNSSSEPADDSEIAVDNADEPVESNEIGEPIPEVETSPEKEENQHTEEIPEETVENTETQVSVVAEQEPSNSTEDSEEGESLESEFEALQNEDS